MKKQMNSDFIQRVKNIMKTHDFLLGIGDIASATKVSQRQLRYWEKRGTFTQPNPLKNVVIVNTLIIL
ncbi:MerR family transcriptional regulator [Pediococcus parvulus]|uniref:MerR family transcriptional regulator n=1 Tax=Pediococcus parvulus TaxID=54062 RepID=UPI00345E53BF